MRAETSPVCMVFGLAKGLQGLVGGRYRVVSDWESSIGFEKEEERVGRVGII